jgi:hypothetical protein
MPSGVASPACSANCQPLRRSTSLSRPATNRPTRRRGSGRSKCRPIRSMSLWSAAAQPPITSLVACPTTMMPPQAAQSTQKNHLTQSKLRL